MRLPASPPVFCLRRNATLLATRMLAFTAAAFGLVVMVVTLWIVVRTYSPVLFWDQWELINTLIKSHGHLSIHDLWAQHNEHRPLTGRLFGFADLYFFHGRNVSLYVEIIVFQLCHLFLFLAIIRPFGSLPATVYVTLAGFLTYCLFSPIQMENFVWAFQTVFVLTSLAATCCCAAAFSHALRTRHGNHEGEIVLLLAALASAFIAEASDADGLVTWPVLLFLAFALRFSIRDRSIIFVTACLAIAAYMIGYKSPDSEQTVTAALSQPAKVFHFAVTYFAHSWDAHLPNPSVFPSVSESLSGLAIVGTIVCSAWSLWRPLAFRPLQIALLGNLLFGVGTAALTALGRLQYGGVQGAMSIRYQTPALVFWASLASFIAVSINWTPPVRLLIAQAAVLILMLAGGTRWLEMAQFAERRQSDQEMGWNAVVENRFDDPVAARIFYSPEILKPFVSYLRQHHWGPSGEITSFARVQGTSGSPQIQGYRLDAQSCLGHWDGAMRSGLASVSVGGWALSQLPREAPRRVGFVSASGKIIGYADLKTVRQDVTAQYPNAQNVKTGWQANLTIPGDGIYRAFLLFDGTHAACPLANELRIRHYPVF
ncbi:MAG: hypothetical protein ACJ746_30400 [Bryobacteraceae bacterium]